MEFLKGIINFLTDPKVLISVSIVLFLIALPSRRIWTTFWAKIIFGAGAVFMLISVRDPNFRKIVTAPDNVPIVGMLFLIGFFVWYGLYKGKRNDDRMLQGLPPKEVEDNEKE